MDFHIDCVCGNRIAVTEGSAGVTLLCTCGKQIAAASLETMRRQAGLSPSTLTPELMIASAYAAGESPPDRRCAVCRQETPNDVFVIVECERIIAVRDLDRLERISDAILTAASWEELLGTR